MEYVDTDEYELVAGLEVHIQLNTNSKAFNRDLNEFGNEPNSNISAITLAHPGTLPKANKRHIEKALRLAFAADSKINQKNQFDRKNYFYPDLPKGYQITQDKFPFCEGGQIKFFTNGQQKTIRLHHIHMEEDAGKSAHDLSVTNSMLDYNRAGTPLVEMVTEPDFRSGEEVHDFMAAIQQMVKYLDVSDGNMEEGSMRCDCNVSVRLKGASEYGERCEIKNVNSKKFARQAVQYEFKRQIAMIRNGDEITKQTLNFNPETGVTTPIRSKEDAHDYRYFPDPDLPPIQLSTEYLESLRKSQPMLPGEYADLLTTEFGLSEYDATVLIQEKAYVLYFLHLAEKYTNYKSLANLLINKVIPSATENGCQLGDELISDEKLYAFLGLIDENKVTVSAAFQRLFPEVIANPQAAVLDVAERLSIIKSEDQGFVDQLAADLIKSHPEEYKKYKNGNKALVGFFMGQAMKMSQGKADPKVLKAELLKKLNA